MTTFRTLCFCLALALLLAAAAFFSVIGFGSSCESPTATPLSRIDATVVAEAATPTSNDPCAPGRVQAKKPDRESTDFMVLPADELRFGMELEKCQMFADAASAFERAVKDADLVDDEPVQSEALRRHGVMLAANGNVEQGKQLIWAALKLDASYALYASALLDIRELETLYLKPTLRKEDIPTVQELTSRKIKIEAELSRLVHEQIQQKQEQYRTYVHGRY